MSLSSTEQPVTEIIDRCMCGGCVSIWRDDKFPNIFQGVMHSPVGCCRRYRSRSEMEYDLYKWTGYEHNQSSFKVIFQAWMGYLARNPDVATGFPVTLTPVPTHPPREITPNSNENTEGGTRVRVASKRVTATRQQVVVNPGPIKPPWVK